MADWDLWHSTSSILGSGDGSLEIGRPGELGVVEGSGSSTWISGCGPGLGEVRSTGVRAPELFKMGEIIGMGRGLGEGVASTLMGVAPPGGREEKKGCGGRGFGGL